MMTAPAHPLPASNSTPAPSDRTFPNVRLVLAIDALSSRCAEIMGGTRRELMLLLHITIDGPTYQNDLAQRLGLSGPGVSHLVKSLIDRALIEVRPSDTDRRRNVIHLTEKACELLERLQRLDSVPPSIVESSGAEALQHLHSTLQHRVVNELRNVSPS